MHFPVLLEEILSYLQPEAGDVILDATAGGGGHARSILEKVVPGGKVIAVDRDAEAVERARGELEGFRDDLTLVNENFRNIDRILASLGIDRINGALFDIGMSSFQVDDAERGFSFRKDGPLDMRFDTSGGQPAADIINSSHADELADIIRRYGEERHAKRIAKAIVEARKRGPIRTTGALTDVITKAVGGRYARFRLHPAARTFQALRICVNDELGALEEAIGKAAGFLRPSGRVCVVSFHSLEDRVVKRMFRQLAATGRYSRLTRKPVRPGDEELQPNPRSRSAKLRVIERI